MKYNKPVFILFLMLFGFYAYSQSLGGPVEVKYVSFNIETFFDISPSGFNSEFSNGEFRFWDLDQHDISSNLVYSYLTKFQKVKQQSVDVRLEIIYSINNVEQKKWMSESGIFTDGKVCYKNKRLFDFLIKTLNTM